MIWLITKDLISRPDEKSAAGRFGNSKDLSAMPIKFRLKDDNGIIYYEGRCDVLDFDPLDWAMEWAGCTIMEYKANRGWKIL